MIRVDHTGIEIPAVLAADGKGTKETAEAIAHYAHAANQGKPFSFKAYGDKAVKAALTRLFHGKCAYCESRFDATQPVDVEHWRPKGAVDEENGTTPVSGYYWLAASWTNLLPSCIDCNRKREHVIHPTGTRRVIGKGNYFPIEPGTARATAPGAESTEKPLLLHPYDDDPATALDLEDEGVLRARPRADGTADSRGEASIRVYALNRTGLVHARREVLHHVEQHIYIVRQLGALLAGGLLPELRDLVEDLVAFEMNLLLDFARPERPYSFAVRCRLARFEAELAGDAATSPK
jgi:uncharacterized protein (TIGR02646 family)